MTISTSVFIIFRYGNPYSIFKQEGFKNKNALRPPAGAIRASGGAYKQLGGLNPGDHIFLSTG